MLSQSEGAVLNKIYASGEFDEYMNTLYNIQCYLKGDYYESKNKRLAEWNPDEGTIIELVIKIFTACLIKEEQTYQAIVGMFADTVSGVEDVFDRVKIVAEVVAIMTKCDLLNIYQEQGKKPLVSTVFIMDDIPLHDKHNLYDMHEVTSNFDEDYGSMILGGAIKHYEDEILLDHLNKVNNVNLSLSVNVMSKIQPEPKTVSEEGWELFIANWYKHYADVVLKGNTFNLVHKYDNRGRTYVDSYYVNYQGRDFQKACVELTHKEIIGV